MKTNWAWDPKWTEQIRAERLEKKRKEDEKAAIAKAARLKAEELTTHGKFLGLTQWQKRTLTKVSNKSNLRCSHITNGEGAMSQTFNNDGSPAAAKAQNTKPQVEDDGFITISKEDYARYLDATAPKVPMIPKVKEPVIPKSEKLRLSYVSGMKYILDPRLLPSEVEKLTGVNMRTVYFFRPAINAFLEYTGADPIPFRKMRAPGEGKSAADLKAKAAAYPPLDIEAIAKNVGGFLGSRRKALLAAMDTIFNGVNMKKAADGRGSTYTKTVTTRSAIRSGAVVDLRDLVRSRSEALIPRNILTQYDLDRIFVLRSSNTSWYVLQSELQSDPQSSRYKKPYHSMSFINDVVREAWRYDDAQARAVYKN